MPRLVDDKTAWTKRDSEWLKRNSEQRKLKYKTDPVYAEKKRNTGRAWLRKSREANPELYRKKEVETRLRYQREDPIKFMLQHKKSLAKKKGVEFKLEPSDLTLSDLCPALGIPLVPFGGQHNPGTASIDRIDPKKGYVKGNVKIISLLANRLKSNCTDSAQLRAVADYVERCQKEVADETCC